jgi:glycosyltransferase involved in cell wall biosynthesis
MHIALVTHRVVKGDGQGRVNLEVAAAALRRGWRVTLVATEADAELLRRGAELARIDVAAWRTALLRNQAFALASGVWLVRHRRTIDIVHANGFITWARPDVNAAHYVHAGWLASPYRPRTRRTIRGAYQLFYAHLNALLERWAYGRSACVIAVSAGIERELGAIGVDAARIRVIPNGVDTREFYPRAPGVHARATAKALFVGDLATPRKNLHTVLRALKDCPDVELAVVGAVERSHYPALAARLGVEERVEFLGFRADVPALMRAADFVVFPSLYEPSGLVLFEALASGVPAITARSVGGVESLADGCALVLDRPDDVGALAAAMRRLASAPELRAEMGGAGRRLAVTLDFGAMAERYCDVYAALVEGRRATAAPGSPALGARR